MNSHITRRQLVTAACTASVASVAGCLASDDDEEEIRPIDVEEIPPPEYEDSANIWSWYNEWTEVLVPEFEEEYGVDLSHATYSDPDEWWTEMQAGNDEIDFIVGAVPQINQGIEDDLIEPLPVDIMQSWEDTSNQSREIAESHFEKDGEIYGISINESYTPCLGYNTNFFDSTPTSWEVFWDDEHEDQVSLMDRADISCRVAALYTGQDPHDPDDFGEIEEVLEQQRPLNRTYFGGWEEVQRMMSNEEIIAAPLAETRAFRSRFDDGAPVSFTIPEEGGVTEGGHLFIPSGGPNPRTALTFFEYSMISENRVRLFSERGQIPAIQNQWEEIEALPDVESEEIQFYEDNIPDDAEMHSSAAFSEDVRQEYVDIWERIRLG